MSRKLTSRYEQRSAEKPVEWPALLRIFDRVWGPEARSLPKYPKIYGAINASWEDSEGNVHEAESLGEVEHAYQNFETTKISFRSFGQKADAVFLYFPAKSTISIDVQSGDEGIIDNILEVVRREFPFVTKYVFISYETSELDFAIYIAKVLGRRCAPGVTVFVAKQDIKLGENPYKIMLEKQLLQAEALVALCSEKSKNSPWLWWESSAVWALGGLVIPLFIHISPTEFKGPIAYVCQGGSYFDPTTINSTVKAIVNKTSPGRSCKELTEDEIKELEMLKLNGTNNEK